MTQYHEEWKLRHVSVCPFARCESDIYSFTIQTLFTPYYRLSPTSTSISLPISVLLLSSCLLSSLLTTVLSFVHMGKSDRAFGSHSNKAHCVSVCCCMKAKISSITTLNCTIKQRTDLFYDCNMRYLANHCHKGAWSKESHIHAYVTERRWWWSWRQMYV